MTVHNSVNIVWPMTVIKIIISTFIVIYIRYLETDKIFLEDHRLFYRQLRAFMYLINVKFPYSGRDSLYQGKLLLYFIARKLYLCEAVEVRQVYLV